jgi:hypothetical protein
VIVRLRTERTRFFAQFDSSARIFCSAGINCSNQLTTDPIACLPSFSNFPRRQLKVPLPTPKLGMNTGAIGNAASGSQALMIVVFGLSGQPGGVTRCRWSAGVRWHGKKRSWHRRVIAREPLLSEPMAVVASKNGIERLTVGGGPSFSVADLSPPAYLPLARSLAAAVQFWTTAK